MTASLGAFSLVELGIVEIHAGMSAVERDARPGNIHGSGIHQRNDADCAGGAQHFPTLGGGLIMRSQRAGNLGGRSGENHNDLAADVESGKVVIILLRDFEAVADKNQRCFDLGRGHDRAC